MYRHTSFYYTLFITLTDIVFFYKLKVYGNLASSKSIGDIFPTFTHFASLCHFDDSCNVSKFFIIMFVMVICDQ